MYLHRYKIPFRQNWTAHPGSPVALSLFTLAGIVGGGAAAWFFYSDAELLRLERRHEEDKFRMVNSSSAAHFRP